MQISRISSVPGRPISAWIRTRSLLVALIMLGGAAGWAGGLPAAPPPDGGTVSIDVKNDDGRYDVPTATYMDAAGQALADKGFTILNDPDHSAYVVELSLHREDVGTGSTKVAPSKSGMAPGGALGSFGTGAIIPIPSGKSRLVALERTTLEMRLRKRGEAVVIWQGKAVTVRSANVQARAATDLCNALLRAYPEQPEGVIGVP